MQIVHDFLPWILVFCLPDALASPSKSTPDCAIPKRYPEDYTNGEFWIQAVYLEYRPDRLFSIAYNPLHVDLDINPITGDLDARDGHQPVLDRLVVGVFDDTTDLFRLSGGELLYHGKIAAIWPDERTPDTHVDDSSPLFPGFNLVGFNINTRNSSTPGLHLDFSIVKGCTPDNETELTLSVKKFSFAENERMPIV